MNENPAEVDQATTEGKLGNDEFMIGNLNHYTDGETKSEKMSYHVSI